MPANNATTPIIVPRVRIICFVFFETCVTFIINANVAMTDVNASEAAANRSGFMNDKATIAPANNPIATVITTRLFLQSFAYFVRAINPANNNSNTDTAAKARPSPSGSILLNINSTPVSTTSAPDIMSNIAPAFAAFSPAKFDTAIRAANINSILIITLIPRLISSSLM